MRAWSVAVDVDAKGGDDDVSTMRVIVEADDEGAAMLRAEVLAAARHGTDNVLGAWAARELFEGVAK